MDLKILVHGCDIEANLLTQFEAESDLSKGEMHHSENEIQFCF